MKFRTDISAYILSAEEYRPYSGTGWFRSRVPWWLIDSPAREYAGASEPLVPAGRRLLPHQEEAVRWLLAQREHPAMRGALIADDMGLGKTISAIVFANTVRAKGVLVVAPAHLLRNWQKEIERWQTLGYPVQIVRKETRLEPGRWYIVSYASAKKIAPVPGDGDGWVVILDEAHYAKNPQAARTQQVLHLRGAMGRAFFVLLTGTPITNRAEDLFTLVDMCLQPTWNTYRSYIGDYSEDGRKAYRWWCRRYVVYAPQRVRGGRIVQKAVGTKNVEELRQLLSHLMLRRTKSEVLDLPDKVVEYIYVDVPAKWRKELEEIFRKLQAEGHRLRFSQHVQHVLREYGLRKVKPATGVIADLVEERGPVVAWVVHHAVADALAMALQKKGLRVATADGRNSEAEKERIVQAFQQGELDVLVAGLTALGTGYTLTASRTAVFVQTTFTPADMRQAEDRIYRIGQTDAVLIRYLVATDGEERILKYWRNKEGDIHEILDK